MICLDQLEASIQKSVRFYQAPYTKQTLQQQCCCNLGFSVVIGVSYKTAAALDVVLLLHHLTTLLLLLLLARCVQTREWTTAPANSTITFLSLRTITWSHCVWWSLDHCSGHSIIVSLSWWLVMMTRDHCYHAIVMTVRAPGVTSSLSQLRVTTEPGSGLEPRICHRLYTCTFTCTQVYSHLFTCVQCNSTNIQCNVVYKTENLFIPESRICILLCTCTHHVLNTSK